MIKHIYYYKRTINYAIKVFVAIMSILLLQNSMKAQENYLPSLVVVSEGDTLNGYIDYKNWEKNPTFISFKKSLSGSQKIYNPKEILEFRVKDEIYISAIVETELTSSKISEIENATKLKLKIDTAFLQTIFSSNKSLYYNNNKLGVDNFYIEQDGKFELLIYKKYRKTQSDKRVVGENKKYIGQLLLYFNDCKSIQSKINSSRYTLKSLKDLFESYYKCTSAETSFEKKSEGFLFEAGVLGGATISTLDFNSSQYFKHITIPDYAPSIKVSAGLFFETTLPRNNRKFSIVNHLLYTNYLFNLTYEDYVSENNFLIANTTIGFSYLKLNTSFKFQYPVTQKGYVYFSGGITNGFILGAQNLLKEEITFYSTKRVEEHLALDNYRKYEFGYFASLGFKYNNTIRFEALFERGSGMSVYKSLNSNSKRLYLLIGYTLFKNSS